MFEFSINNKPVTASKFFSQKDIDVVTESLDLRGISSILFIDTPPTPFLVNFLWELHKEGRQVVVVDHHATKGNSDRDASIKASVADIRGLASAGHIIRYSTREEHPACSSLVDLGEFSHVDAVVCDPDPDGLLGALKALGLTYPELDADAAVLDGPRGARSAATLSPLGLLLDKGMATLPPYNPNDPSASEGAKRNLFQDFVYVVQGGKLALERLTERVAAYDLLVEAAHELVNSERVTLLNEAVAYVDVRGFKPYHMGTADALVGKGRKVVVTLKDKGPIANLHGVQYTLARQPGCDSVDFKKLLPEGTVSSPEAGLICNTPFLLHLSQDKWEEMRQLIIEGIAAV